jgi:epoxyqueuosine reductase
LAGVNISDEIKAILTSKGADMIGFADLRGLPADIRNNLPSGISIAVALNPGIVKEISDGPTGRYYDEYVRANSLLDSLGSVTARFLEEKGHRAAFFAATDAGIDAETLSTRLPHKTVATRAGMGWIGKCALLITDTFGSAVRITSVLTDAALPAGEAVDESRCGDCDACVDACPGRAPSGEDWRVGLQRDDFFDAYTCRKTARELMFKNTGVRVSICGICIAVCPWTQKYLERVL